MASILDRRSELEVPRHDVRMPRFPVIDIHTHWGRLLGAMTGSKTPHDLYDTATAVEAIRLHGIERIVNVDGGFGDEYRRMMDKLRPAGDFMIHFGQVPVERFEEPTFEAEIATVMRQHHEAGVRGLKVWKNVGLGLKDSEGRYLKPTDPRLRCIWEAAAEFDMPVLIHISDLNAFFRPADSANEYIATLRAHPEWRVARPDGYSFAELIEMQEELLSANRSTTFVVVHVGSWAENLAEVGRMLDEHPNMHVDIADRLNELGRQPYTARRFFLEHADRILFGSDLLPTDIARYPIYWRFLETFDEYFPYRTPEGVELGDWNIYGIGLPDDVLRKVYRDNALRLLGSSADQGTPS
jgi:predicted TIM-barrel fold metal-dependent hydrolase